MEPLTHQTTGRGRPAPFRRPRAPPGISGTTDGWSDDVCAREAYVSAPPAGNANAKASPSPARAELSSEPPTVAGRWVWRHASVTVW